MSAEVLREAAALMRERAKAATSGPWRAQRWVDHAHDGTPCVVGGGGFSMRVVDCAPDDAEHIASWHPAVALAVADWLDDTAVLLENTHPVPACDLLYDGNALAVARAYLGSAS